VEVAHNGSSVECRILATLQEGLPVSRTPYEDLARRNGIPVGEVLHILRNWRQDGAIRRTGAVVNHLRLGIAGSAMVAWRVPPERRTEVGSLFAGFEEVSHACERQTVPDWVYSIYTMVHGTTPEAVRLTVQQMGEAAAVSEHLVLPTLDELKKAAPRYAG